MEMYKRSKAQLTLVQTNLQQAEKIAETIQAARKGREAVDKLIAVRGASYNLYTAIYRAVQSVGMTDRAVITSIPKEMTGASAVRLTLNGVSMEELVDLLYGIQSADKLVVLHEVTHLQPSKDGKGLECNLVLVTPTA